MGRILHILSLTLLIFFDQADARMWTTVEGRTQSGELFEVDGEEVGIKIKGREYRFLINRFIPSDRQYIRDGPKYRDATVVPIRWEFPSQGSRFI